MATEFSETKTLLLKIIWR